MIDQDEEVQKKIEELERLSVDELEEKITELKAEISLCEAEIEKKKAQKSAADALFS